LSKSLCRGLGIGEKVEVEGAKGSNRNRIRGEDEKSGRKPSAAGKDRAVMKLKKSKRTEDCAEGRDSRGEKWMVKARREGKKETGFFGQIPPLVITFAILEGLVIFEYTLFQCAPYGVLVVCNWSEGFGEPLLPSLSGGICREGQ
jgi:hypothetical protein